MWLPLEYIPLFAVHGDIEAFHFLFLSDPQAHHQIADLQNDERSHDGQHPSDGAADSLIQDLAGAAIHQAEAA